jgi:hypothetical protein
VCDPRHDRSFANLARVPSLYSSIMYEEVSVVEFIIGGNHALSILVRAMLN